MPESIIVEENIIETIAHLVYIFASVFIIYILSKAYFT